MKKCPFCNYEGAMIDVDGYILECPECGRQFNEDDY